MSERLYMAVTPDDFELPLAVERNINILAAKTGFEVSTIKTMISRGEKTKHIKFIKIETDN